MEARPLFSVIKCHTAPLLLLFSASALFAIGCSDSSNGAGSGSGNDSAADSLSDTQNDGTGDTDGNTNGQVGSDSDSDSENDTGSTPLIGCQKVDFLFVIDNSVSMKDQQAALISSFPGFMETIKKTLSAKSDYHIMVVDTDAYGRCTQETCADQKSSCRSSEKGFDEYICDHIDEFSSCDMSWGAGVIHPAGAEASNTLCTIHGGNRYIIGEDPDMTTAFACIARVGLSGNPEERPMDAMVAAISDKLNGKKGCNEGFIRDDAILVVTFITDDPHIEDMEPDSEWDSDFGPSDSVDDWYNALVGAKNGNADAVVVLGLLPVGTNSAGQSCEKGDSGQHWLDLVNRFGDHGLTGPVCEEEYVSFFEDAVALIDDSCDDFEPVK